MSVIELNPMLEEVAYRYEGLPSFMIEVLTVYKPRLLYVPNLIRMPVLITATYTICMPGNFRSPTYLLKWPDLREVPDEYELDFLRRDVWYFWTVSVYRPAEIRNFAGGRWVSATGSETWL